MDNSTRKIKTRKKHKKKGGNLDDNDNSYKDKMIALLKSDEFTNKVLNKMCNNSKVCLDFGDYKEQVKNYFNNFTDFTMTKPAKTIGSSSNGAVILIPYEKNNYKSYAILKFALSAESDNLMYEYTIGKGAINNVYSKFFPSFTETYGLYSLPNDLIIRTKLSISIKKRKPIDINTLNLTSLNSATNMIDIAKFCEDPIQYCVLTQYFPNFISISNECMNGFPNAKKEFPCLLYQIYFALDKLKDKFTHYDLHPENAGFYQPFYNKYIIMNYHLENGETISFPTLYISKIIDYGRCHIAKATNQIIDTICNLSTCQPNCGEDFGFVTIKGLPNEPANIQTSSFHWINPYVINRSHDLRLIANLKLMIPDFQKEFPFFNDIVYFEMYGTPEDLTPYDSTQKIIRNVSDARKSLEDFLPGWCQNELNEQYYIDQDYVKAGEMHIYSDGKTPYRYS